MKFKKTNDTYAGLIQKLKKHGYSKSYITRLKTEINWLICNQGREDIQSYGDACRIRIGQTKSREMQTTYRRVYRTLEEFDLYGRYPAGVCAGTPAERGSYWQLNPVFREVIDAYKDSGAKRGLKESTLYKTAFSASSFLLAMQNRGRESLNDITEDDVISYFIRDDGLSPLSGGHRDTVASVFKSDLGIHTELARRILSYIPVIRQRRKNIPYLNPEEAEAIRNTLSCPGSELCMRDKAIGMLLFFTGIRGCDISCMKFSDIDWEKEEIRITQQKTANGLILPMSAAIGNAIYDYVTVERPSSEEPYIFLCRTKPYSPLSRGSVWKAVSKVYGAAGIRQDEGSRQGTHLFRHHVASALAGNGIARPVISETLGHTAPKSLDCYLSADIQHLRECALSIELFPVSGEVFPL
ncbi:MAG: tyrosine-type recombinase/integrase [Eubacteriales bacterium]|nr:tyrosine-type recombinase/integrase [Eubacteriales bacterium]